jgi:riboflavin kinase/FMN adenylyltransferase
MKIYGKAALPPGGSVVAIGIFDGLHLGHRAVIERALAIARQRKLAAVVLTFDLSGRHRPAAKTEGKRLLSPERFEGILRGMGVDALVRLAFDDIRSQTPGDFARLSLSEGLSARAVCCGENFRFGRGASAGAAELSAFGGALGFSLELLPLSRYRGEPVSASRIRLYLQQGKTREAAEMLGYRYAIDFRVETGRRLGHTIGMPTINQPFPEGYLLPCFGVYASVTAIDGVRYPSVTNIGVKPTVGSDHTVAETYISGYSGNLYGSRPTVELVEHLRPERKFPDVEALGQQMRLDLEQALAVVAGNLV